MKKRDVKGKGPSTLVTWLGHSAFHIESPGGKHILIDPWLDNPKAPPAAREINKVDLILVTHGHGDHLGNTIELARRTNAAVYAIYELSLYLQNAGVTKVVGMNISGTACVDDISITMVEALHSCLVEEAGHTGPGGTPVGFVVKLENGSTLYHAGDTGLFGDMKLIAKMYKPKLVILPIGGLYTMGPVEAAEACTLLNPRHILGMHYGTFPPLAGTPSDLKKALPPRFRPMVHELQPGGTFEFR